MKKFLAIIAITSIMASCTDSGTSEEGTSADSSGAIQSAPMDTSSSTLDTSVQRGDSTTRSVDSPASR
jgi:hypothetical protein